MLDIPDGLTVLILTAASIGFFHTSSGLILLGLGGAPIASCCATVAARWFPEHERAIFAGLQGAGLSIGIALGFVIVPQMLHVTGGSW